MTDNDKLPPFFPVPYDVEEGKVYYWCGCGNCKNQPLADLGHCSKAVPYHALLTETVYFCGCKQTGDPPLCDGSHAALLREYLKKRDKTGK